MVICLDTVGRKPVTVGRADDNSVLSKGECFSYTQNTIASPSLQTNKNETNTVLPTGNLGKTYISCSTLQNCDSCWLIVLLTSSRQPTHVVRQHAVQMSLHTRLAQYKTQVR